MSGTEPGGCSYTHELDDGTWECPHRTDEGDLCPFHRPPDGKDDDRVARALLERVGGSGRREKEFVGAHFGDLDLAFARVDAADNYPVSLVDATVEGDVTLTSAETTQPLILDGLEVTGDVHAENATVAAEWTAADVAIGGTADFQGVTFEDRTRFRRTEFAGPANFYAAEFGEAAVFDGATFAGPADFGSSTFRESATFEGTQFGDDADFGAVDVADDARFGGAAFDGDVNFRDAAFGGTTVFGTASPGQRTGSEADARGFRPGEDHFEFEGVLEHVHRRAGEDATGTDTGRDHDPGFHGVADFSDAEVTEEALFENLAFESPPVFAGATFHDPVAIRDPRVGGREVGVDLTDAELSAGTLDQPDEGRIVYDLTKATVGDVDVAGGGRSPFEHCRFLHTTFDGFDFGQYRDSLASADFRIHTVAEGTDGRPPDENSDPTVGDLEATYLKAKNGADAAGDNRAAAEFFRRELINRRHGHAKRFREGGGPVQRAVAGGQWLANLLHDLSCGYGERPSRVVFFALAVILGFAPVYWGLHPEPVYDHLPLFGYVVVSFESFATLIHGGGPQLSSGLFRFVTEIEAFFGVFVGGLFVFALTRSINR